MLAGEGQSVSFFGSMWKFGTEKRNKVSQLYDAIIEINGRYKLIHCALFAYSIIENIYNNM